MSGWRIFALILGALIAICGALFWRAGGGVMILVFGVLIMITSVLDPIYGKASARPLGGNWHATDERFVDPETGKLVTVWFNAERGERRYVEEGTNPPPSS